MVGAPMIGLLARPEVCRWSEFSNRLYCTPESMILFHFLPGNRRFVSPGSRAGEKSPHGLSSSGELSTPIPPIPQKFSLIAQESWKFVENRLGRESQMVARDHFTLAR